MKSPSRSASAVFEEAAVQVGREAEQTEAQEILTCDIGDLTVPPGTNPEDIYYRNIQESDVHEIAILPVPLANDPAERGLFTGDGSEKPADSLSGNSGKRFGNIEEALLDTARKAARTPSATEPNAATPDERRQRP